MKTKNKYMKASIIIPTILSIILISAGGIIIYNLLNSQQDISISGYYDSNGNLITGTQNAFINGIAGVKYITIKVSAQNKDTVSLDAKITDASPVTFKNALILNNIQAIPAGGTVEWNSDLIDISSYVNTTQSFYVKVLFSSPFRSPVELTSTSLNIKIDPDPSAQGSVVITSSNSNTTSGSSTSSSSSGGGTTVTPPTGETQTSSTFQTDAVAGAYTNYKSGTYVRVDSDSNGILEEYTYASTITAGACGGTLLTTTPEGYLVNKYSGSSGTSIYICNPSSAGYKRYT